MNLLRIKCTFCKKVLFRTKGRINEAKKFHWKPYCSLKCQGSTRKKSKKITLKCQNPTCNKIFEGPRYEISDPKIHFCSRSCANTTIGARRREIKICAFCERKFWGDKKVYCSALCHLKASRIPKITREDIVNKIKEFTKKERRIPFKEEFPHYNTAQERFGSWNKAIEAAGFEPNPVKFSKKFIAADGHRCDSLAEKIIDDWLYSRNIKHERSIPYPGKHYTADFQIKGKFVEFFGLNGEIVEYDKNIKIKEGLAKKHKIDLVKIYPKDLFPINRLAAIIKN